jgi:carbon storage regulator
VLVLTRRLNERVVFPGIGAAIGVVALKPSVVRLGIEAPPDVTVFREEVYRRLQAAGTLAPLSVTDAPADLTQPDGLLLERLNGIALGLALLRRRLQASATLQAWATLEQLEEGCQDLLEQLRGAPGVEGRVPLRPVPASTGRGVGSLR